MFIITSEGRFETDPGDIVRELGLDGLHGLDIYSAFEAMLWKFLDDGDIRSYDRYEPYLDVVYSFAMKHEMGA